MLILDTDHFSEYLARSAAGQRLRDRLVDFADVVTTIITVEEQSRGWLARLKQVKNADERIRVYARFHHMIETLGSWRILHWDVAASRMYGRLGQLKLKIGTSDLMIVSIALAQGATLLSRNLRDFERVADLDVADWLA